MNKIFKINGKLYIFDGNRLELYLKDDTSELTTEEEVTSESDKYILHKLVFNVSNSCNLNCKYCYANGGNYNRKNALMTIEESNTILEEVISKYNEIETVYFFGGEPLLNFKVIKHIVLTLEKHFGKNNLDFRTVTNGVFLSKEKIDFFSQHNFKIYISIDGPEEIHDYLRGKGTFKIINKQLDYIKTSPISSKTELLCTYTKFHQDNISFNQLENFFKQIGLRYNINGVDTTDLTLKLTEKKTFIEREKQYIDISLNRIINFSNNVGISYYLSSVIDALLFHNKQKYFCKELTNNYSNVYDFNGDVYSCIRLLGKYKINSHVIQKANQKDYKLCQNCWCKNICNVCVAEILLKVNEYPYNENKCQNIILYEYALEKIILLLENDKDKLSIVLNNYVQKFLK